MAILLKLFLLNWPYVLCFRYLKYIGSYRIYQQSYETPEFAEPPAIFREYEVQVIFYTS